MAYTVTEDFAAHTEISDKLETLLNAITGDFVACGVEKVGQDRFLVYVVEVAT